MFLFESKNKENKGQTSSSSGAISGSARKMKEFYLAKIVRKKQEKMFGGDKRLTEIKQ